MKKVLLLATLFSTSTFAQNGVESCIKINEDNQRLSCYDELFLKESQTEENTKSKWEYVQDKDEMREAVSYRATNLSNNSVNFGFPYGESNAAIILRKDPSLGNDVMFSIISGQFNSCFDGCKIAVKFDNEKLENYAMVGTDDGTSDLLFISSAKNMKRFTEKLRKAKKVIVEAQFFDYGRAQFQFDVSGLDWKHF